MKFKQTWLTVLLCCLSALMLLSSCDSTPIGDKETQAQTEVMISLEEMKTYIAEATIVRSEDASQAVITAIQDMRKALKEAFGAQPDFVDDYVRKGEEVKQAKREILVGTTNRTQSNEALEQCMAGEQPLDYYIAKLGDHYVIYANDKYISKACEAFVEMMIQNHNRSFSTGQAHVALISDFKIGTEPITSFTSISYPDTYTKKQEADVKEAADIIFEATGQRLVPVQGKVEKNAFVLGAFSELEGGDYKTALDQDNKLFKLGGGNYYADIRALYQVVIHGALGYRDGEFHNPKSLSEKKLGTLVPFDEDPDLVIGAWMTNAGLIDQEFLIRDAAEANFNLLSIEWHGDYDHMHNLLKWGAMYDVSFLFVDYSCYMSYDTTYSSTNAYENSPNHWGTTLLTSQCRMCLVR